MPESEVWLWVIRTITSLVGLSLGAIGAWKAYFQPNNGKWKVINTLVWTIGAPLWFVVEYTILYPTLDGIPAHKDDLRHGQGLAKAFWAGIGALLVTIYKKAENEEKKTETARQVEWESDVNSNLKEVRANLAAVSANNIQANKSAEDHAERVLDSVAECTKRIAQIEQTLVRIGQARN